MNLYPDRIEELHEFLAAKYQQYDRQATEILLAAQLSSDITRMRKPWIVIETDYPSRDCTDAWFAFGGEAEVKSLAVPRVLRCKPSEDVVRDWLTLREQNATGLFVESEWRRLIKLGRGSTFVLRMNYMQLLSVCIRLRVNHPRGDYALRLDRSNDRIELARLTRRVLSSDLRPGRNPSEVTLLQSNSKTPASLLYWCELLQRLNPWLNDWESLTSSLVAVARNIALLYADGRDPDWAAADRLLRDCIGASTADIIHTAQSGGTKGIVRLRLFSRDADKMAVSAELNRLCKEGILWRSRGKYGLTSNDWAELLDRTKQILI